MSSRPLTSGDRRPNIVGMSVAFTTTVLQWLAGLVETSSLAVGLALGLLAMTAVVARQMFSVRAESPNTLVAVGAQSTPFLIAVDYEGINLGEELPTEVIDLDVGAAEASHSSRFTKS